MPFPGRRRPGNGAEVVIWWPPMVLRDVVFPSSNQYGVPDLLPAPRCRSLKAPFAGWGTVARKSSFSGTWHFYVDDYRFDHLLSDPGAPLRTACAGLVEPNFSTYDWMPFAVSLHQIYKKRWVARCWQEARPEVSLWVDVCAGGRGRELALLGVPEGWVRYATAGFDSGVEDLDEDLKMVVERSAGERFALLVYGGGAEVESWCSNRNGVLRVPHRRAKAARAGQGTRRRLMRELADG